MSVKKIDSNGNQILSEDYEQDDKTKALKMSRRKIQKYNSNGKEILAEEYSWISSKNALEIDRREKTEYDSKGNITHWERWGWYDSEHSADFYKDSEYNCEYKYDSNGKLLSISGVNRGESQSSRWETKYDSKGNKIVTQSASFSQ
jgi:hypothetical protein